MSMSNNKLVNFNYSFDCPICGKHYEFFIDESDYERMLQGEDIDKLFGSYLNDEQIYILKYKMCKSCI